MYSTCFICLKMKILPIKLGRVVTCRAQKRHLSLALLAEKSRKVFSRTCVVRFFSNGQLASDTSEGSRELLTFDDIISLRRKQAKKSLLIEASSKNNSKSISKICEKFGQVEAMFNYSQTSGKEMFLVECATLEMQQELLKYCHYPNEPTGLPVHSRLLYLASNVTGIQSTNHDMPESIMQEKTVPCDTIAGQMERIYSNERLQELGTRLRFLICQLVEDSVVGLFPRAEVIPFGSSVNGFGRNNCDLDMTLHFMTFAEAKTPLDSNLCFFTRRQSVNERKQHQQNLEVIGDMIKTFYPGVVNVDKILRARIPIIKFYHSVTGIECDLCLSNRSGFYMAELLHLYGELDSRVRPLVFTVRLWAKSFGLTQPVAGHWITNFTLTLMVLFFLQNRPVPILPSIQSLVKLADADDHRQAEGFDCTFQRKVWKIPTTGNTEDTGYLLTEFFLFYEKFNFKHRGLSLIMGKEIQKPDGSVMYIENPLERQLNVSINVNDQEIEKLREAARSSIWKLESDSSADKSRLWGLLKLLEISPVDCVENFKRGAFPVGKLFREESESSKIYYALTAVSKTQKVSSGLVKKTDRGTVPLEKPMPKSNLTNNKSYEGDAFVDKGTKSRRKRRNELVTKT